MITSLLDTDLYKFKMLYFLWKMDLHETQVTYRLTNRGDVDPFEFIVHTLQHRIYNLRELKLSFEDLEHLFTLIPDRKFINWLSKLELGWDSWKLCNPLEYSGSIGAIILYETPIMSIINQMFTEKILKGMGRYAKEHDTHFRNKLRTKLFQIADINALCETDKKIKFTEFGTRRRSSLASQKLAITTALEICPEAIVGTSNVMLAREYGLKAQGTIAHEMFMLYATHAAKEATIQSTYRDMVDSQIELVNLWRMVFPETLWLTDTYGSEWFLRNMPDDLYGYRQDSGDPEMFMDRLDNHKLLGKGKKIMFSDGLDVTQMIKLRNKYPDEDISFGWGTNLTNDGLVEPLRIVIKLHSVEGEGTVKLSDNINKAIGSKDNIQKYKTAFYYNETNSLDIKY